MAFTDFGQQSHHSDDSIATSFVRSKVKHQNHLRIFLIPINTCAPGQGVFASGQGASASAGTAGIDPSLKTGFLDPTAISQFLLMSHTVATKKKNYNFI
jgi:hypothetical protein